MSEYVVWHNPRCSKSRQTLALLEEKGIEPEIYLYLEDPPTENQIEEVLHKLGLEPRQLLRSKEKAYREQGLDDPNKTHSELVEAMSAEPILIERPIVVRGERAVLGRPPENALALLD